jgi:glutathione S-transferase
MSVILYDLADGSGRLFSPNCWRTRMALTHKGLEIETRPTRFTDIAGICGGTQKTIPVIEDGATVLGDSWAIALYLEDAYPDAPSLFGSDEGRTYAQFVQAWAQSQLHARLTRLIIKDIHDRLDPADQAYFRASREKLLAASLEEVHDSRDSRIEDFRAALQPARLVLGVQSYLGGDAPRYADYLLFGALQWARVISPLQLLEPEDEVQRWFERCLDLHGGIGRAEPACL